MPYWLTVVCVPGPRQDWCSTGEGIAWRCPTCHSSHNHCEEL